MSRLDFRRSQHLSSLSPVSRWQRDHEGSRRLSTRDAADLLVALLYGPAARCKPKVMIWRSWVLRFCIRPLTERLSSWPSWISARARSHSRLGPEGHKGHLITNALARPFLHLLISTRRPRRETTAFGDQPEPSPRSHRRSFAQ